MIRWHLNEVMAKHHIKGSDLAQEVGVRPEAVSAMKRSTTLPGIGGDRLDSLLEALNKLAHPDTVDKSIELCDLLTWKRDNQQQPHPPTTKQ